MLPADWVAAVQAPHGPGESMPGKYGYQWWLGPDGASYADGMVYQLAIAFPRQAAALAFTCGIPRRSNFDALVFRHFPAAFAAPADPGADARLAARCRTLRLLPEPRRTASPVAAAVSGRTFAFAENADGITAIRLDFAGDAAVFTLTDARGTHAITVGLDRAIEGTTTMTGHALHHEYEPETMRVSATGEWRDRWSFAMTGSFVETGVRDTAVCRFEGPDCRFDRGMNVDDAATSRPTATGTLAGGPYL